MPRPKPARAPAGPSAPRRKPGRPPEPDALFRSIAAAMRRRIESGDWPTGRVLPSLRALAAEFGAGPVTVRGATRLLCLEGILEKVRGGRLAVREPHAVPEATARLALLVVSSYLDHFLRTSYGRELFGGLALEVANQGRPLLLAHNFRYLRALPPRLDALPAQGVLLWGHFLPEILSAYEALQIPAVLVDRPPGRWRLHAACVDNEAAARDATLRLAALGHRRVAFIRQIVLNVRDADPDTLERQRGYEAGLRAARLPVRAERIVNSPAEDTPGSPSIRSLFEGRAPPTAVLAVDAVKARLVADAARARGLAVPKDLSIACFQEREAAEPGFSGPRADFAELGRQAALLLREPRRPCRVRRVPAPWFDGATVAPPRGGRPLSAIRPT
ncbi:MAG: substrate-binding domain-containing protein [Planctomycetota bacterium]|nr:substrate-binding domain-containing protein [Planctomycetota bacterium]